jgi:hypothetical protein
MSAISDRIAPTTASPLPVIKEGCINPFAGNSTGEGEEKGVWGLIYNDGLWSVHDQGGSSKCHTSGHTNADHYETGELLGFDNTNMSNPTAVGFYNDSHKSCRFIPAEIQASVGDSNWQPITVAWPTTFSSHTDVMATGITGSGSTGTRYIVGEATDSATTLSVHNLVGWLLRPSSTTALVYSYPGSSSTAFTGIAVVGGVREIVGWYTLSGSTHGVVAVENSAHTKITGTEIPDPPDAHGLTIVSGINSKGDICGWYKDVSGTYHGFVGLGVVSVLRKHHQRHVAAKHPVGLRLML